jgi:hypothetical protein
MSAGPLIRVDPQQAADIVQQEQQVTFEIRQLGVPQSQLIISDVMMTWLLLLPCAARDAAARGCYSRGRNPASKVRTRGFTLAAFVSS